jgi:iron complex transport system substrate-binding protein
MRWFEAAFIALWTLMMSGAAIGANPSEIVTTDFMARRVTLPRPATRVVSLAPSLTEIVFQVGAGDSLVGRTSRCNEPPEAARVRDIGPYGKPDLERIQAVKPDLALAPALGLGKEVVARLTAMGVPVFVDNCSSLDDIALLVRRLGRLLGRESRAEAVARAFEERRRAVAARAEGRPKPKALFSVGLKPLVIAGGKSFIGAMIREAGGVNIAEDVSTPYPVFSIEEAIIRDPDVIIVLNKECSGQDCLRAWERHQGLTAVRNRAIFELDADIMTRACPRILDGFERLADILDAHARGRERLEAAGNAR